MERTVPVVVSEEIDLYLRTYYSLLRTTEKVRIRSLEEVHTRTNSLMHQGASNFEIDIPALIYSWLRIPECVKNVSTVILGQRVETFIDMGIGNVGEWEQVSAIARRRRCFYDNKETLACLLASRTDIDDVVPILVAYQIEWNKIHLLMKQFPKEIQIDNNLLESNEIYTLLNVLQINYEDLKTLAQIWGDQFGETLKLIASKKQDISIQLLSSSLSDYRRAIHEWWERIEDSVPEIKKRPIYFISSNSHSFINLITGFALKNRKELEAFIPRSNDKFLQEEWEQIKELNNETSVENFLYYVQKKYLSSPYGLEFNKRLKEVEKKLDIKRILTNTSFDLEAQIIDLKNIDLELLDPRIKTKLKSFQESNALILNIDYPLGMAAYDVLRKVSDHAGKLRGIYIMGKAATLNATVGDVMIHSVVYDSQSRNTYLYNNYFEAHHVSKFLHYGNVLDNQKSVTVRGTFLQNQHYMDNFYRDGYTCIEMEAGPYLSAMYEMMRAVRHPIDEIVNLYKFDTELGILHYASDKPLEEGQNLGTANMSYYGMDSTYACAVAILQRIIQREEMYITEEI